MLYRPIAFAVVCVTLALASRGLADDTAEFRRTIGPLLARRCVGCHDPHEKKGGLDLSTREGALAGGESGPAVVPGKAEGSRVWQRIAAGEMPPEKPLPEAERKLLKQWLISGALWQGGALDPLAYSSDTRAGYDWWALQPLAVVNATPAEPPRSPWQRNRIDGFVEARLRQAGLAPSGEADRATLLRRLSFDLTGLPPTESELRAFLDDRSPDAYEKQVDRLLASPGYGERWARHWLDVARFGESQGFERDKLRSNSWRYRDWVIQALNRDLPYDEFARLQIAGDALFPGDPAALIATGFLVAGPWDEVGKNQQSAAMKAVVRQDELEDIVSTVGQTFLGLTVNCARCHDHKFDPIRQVEYYRMTAAFAGVQHGEPSLPPATTPASSTATAPAATPAGTPTPSATLIERIRLRQRAIDQRLAAMLEPHRQALLAARPANKTERTPPQPYAAWDFKKGLNDQVGTLHLVAKDGPTVRGGMLMLEGKGYVASPPLSQDLREKTLEAWVQMPQLDQRGGGVIGVQSLDGATFDGIVFGEREPRRWVPGSDHFRRTQDVGGPEETVSSDFVHIAIAYHADGTIATYRNGLPYGRSYRAAGLASFAKERAQVTLGVRHTPAVASRLLKGAVQKARLYDRALSADEVAASFGITSDHVLETDLLARLSQREKSERDALRFELDQLRIAEGQANESKVYAVLSTKPEATHLLHRGNPGDRRQEVTAGGIASLKGPTAEFTLDASATDAERRRALSGWITSTDNPLFARVIVNRLWHHHFGVGIVDSPNDFGFNGGRPSHPELLDWLASELVRNGYRLKTLHRLMVTSATYRQASRFRAEAARVDGGNRWLWRKTPQRLEAETLRDALLQFAGKLDRSLYGPGFREFTTFVRNSQFYVMQDGSGPTFERRTIYRTWVRSARSPLLDAFDCPDPSTKTPQRAVTTTPLQALSLMNNAFVLRMADACAADIITEAGANPRAQVQALFERILGRSPDAAEAEASTSLAQTHGLAAVCRALFNSNELLFVE